MLTEELIAYMMKRASFKARQIVRRYPDLGDAKDVEQELIVDVLRRMKKYDPERASAKTFISRVIDYVGRMMMRQAARSSRYRPSRGSIGRIDGSTSMIDRSRAHRGVFAKDAQAANDLRKDVESIIKTLSPRLAKVASLLMADEKPTNIFTHLHMAPSTFSRAMALLSKKFRDFSDRAAM